MNAAKVVILTQNHASSGIETERIAAAIPPYREEIGNGVSAISHIAMRGRKLINAIDPLRAYNPTPAGNQIPSIILGYWSERRLKVTNLSISRRFTPTS